MIALSAIWPGSQSGVSDSSTTVVAACWEKEGGKIKAWSERAVLV